MHEAAVQCSRECSRVQVVGVLGVVIAALYIFQEKLLYVPVVPGVPADYWLTADKYRLASKVGFSCW